MVAFLARQPPPFRPHPLRELAIDLTSQCTLTCGMCSVWKGRRDGIAGARVAKLLAEARALGAEIFTPCGAEVFMRKDTPVLLEEAGRLGYREIVVVTNGMLLSRHVRRLSRIPGLMLHVSIDGPEEVHDRLRGAGSYRAALQGLRAAIDAGIPAGLQCVVMKPTLATLDHIVELARTHGLARVAFQPFQPEIAGPAEDHSAWIFAEEDRARLGAALEALLEKARLAGVVVGTESLFGAFVPYLLDGRRPVPESGCHMPARFVLIDSRGETFPCFFMRGRSMGNVAGGVRLRDIWHGPLQRQMQGHGLAGTCPGCLASCSDVDSFDLVAARAQP
jgi:MoaA/NifB/PqqE/SkfB family radical SAM enzyme